MTSISIILPHTYNTAVCGFNSRLYQQASAYAQKRGLNLTTVIENFLMRFVGTSKNATEQEVPDVVQSLLGAGEKVSEDDMNAREAYYG